MNNKATRRGTDEKIRIVLQSFNSETKVAELCSEHNLAPRTLYTGRRGSYRAAENPWEAQVRAGRSRGMRGRWRS